VDSLKEHEIRHDAEKPFICILCKKDFVLKSSLSRHIITLHGVDPTPIVESDKCLKTTVLSQNWYDRADVSVYEQNEMKEPPEFSSSPEVDMVFYIFIFFYIFYFHIHLKKKIYYKKHTLFC
jgi:uncharacterized Zn-finger protein